MKTAMLKNSQTKDYVRLRVLLFYARRRLREFPKNPDLREPTHSL